MGVFLNGVEYTAANAAATAYSNVVVAGTSYPVGSAPPPPAPTASLTVDITLAAIFGGAGWRTFGPGEGSPDSDPTYTDPDGTSRAINGMFWGPAISGNRVRLSLVNPSAGQNIPAADWPDELHVTNGANTAEYRNPVIGANQSLRTQIDYTRVSTSATGSSVFVVGDTVTLELFYD